MLPKETRLLSKRTPNDFVFNVKAVRISTQNQTRPQMQPRNVQATLGDRGGENLCA